MSPCVRAPTNNGIYAYKMILKCQRAAGLLGCLASIYLKCVRHTYVAQCRHHHSDVLFSPSARRLFNKPLNSFLFSMCFAFLFGPCVARLLKRFKQPKTMDSELLVFDDPHTHTHTTTCRQPLGRHFRQFTSCVSATRKMRKVKLILFLRSLIRSLSHTDSLLSLSLSPSRTHTRHTLIKI